MLRKRIANGRVGATKKKKLQPISDRISGTMRRFLLEDLIPANSTDLGSRLPILDFKLCTCCTIWRMK